MGTADERSAEPAQDLDALRIREAARAIILTPTNHLLLVRFEFPGGTRWALPGGGIDGGETAEQALRRELDEELGFLDPVIGPHVWNRIHVIPFIGGRWDGQREQIHLVRIDQPFEPHPRFSWEQLNAEHLFELRWWSVEDVVTATDVHFVPARLGELLDDLIANGAPESPVDTGV